MQTKANKNTFYGLGVQTEKITSTFDTNLQLEGRTRAPKRTQDEPFNISGREWSILYMKMQGGKDTHRLQKYIRSLFVLNSKKKKIKWALVLELINEPFTTVDACDSIH